MRIVNRFCCNVFLAVFFCSAGLGLTWNPEQSWQMFDSGYQTYNYAPSSLISEDGSTESHFYCSNKDGGVVIDYIYLTQRIDGFWQPKTVVLSPGSAGTWDSVHVCDPAVVKGTFNYEGTSYQWAMFYLGCDVTTSTHNQIGVAFANDLAGPWVKWSGNPIVPFASYSYWGVGQPSATSVDGQGHVLLFYSKGDPSGTRILRRELDLSDMSSPVIGPDVIVPKTGLTTIDGSPVIFHNSDFVYDSIRGKFFVSRPRHPFDASTPNFISSQLQIACIDEDAIWAGYGSWQVLGNISVNNSTYPRNHNSGILRTPYGGLPDFERLRVIFAVGVTGDNWLWSYRLHSITGDLVKFDLANNDGRIDLADFSVWTQYWGQADCEPNACGYYADYNFDGRVDLADLGFFTEQWLRVDDHLIGWYRLDEDAGSIAVDSSANGYDGYIHNAEWVPGYTGGGLNFRGLSGNADYVECGTFDPTLSGTPGQMSVTYWVKWNGYNERYQSFIAKRFEWDQSDWVWHVGMGPAADTVFFWTGDGTDVWLGAPPPVGEWTHVAITTDGTTLRMYYNGVLQISGPYALGSGTTDTPVRFGSTNAFDGLNGVMDDVRFYGDALSQQDIQNMIDLE